MKTIKKRIVIRTIDQISGRLLVDAPGVVEGTVIDVHLNGSAEAWGTGIISNEQAHIVGLPLPDQYSLTLTAHPLNPKLLPTE